MFLKRLMILMTMIRYRSALAVSGTLLADYVAKRRYAAYKGLYLPKRS